MDNEILSTKIMERFTKRFTGVFYLRNEFDNYAVEFQYNHERSSNMFWARVMLETKFDGKLEIIEFVPKQYMKNAFDAVSRAMNIYRNRLQVLSISTSNFFQ